MRGLDSCEKCIHRSICQSLYDIHDFYVSTGSILRVLKQGSGIRGKAYELLADNCKHYNDKNIKTPQIWVEIIGKVPLIDFYGVHKDSKYQPAPTYNICRLFKLSLSNPFRYLYKLC